MDKFLQPPCATAKKVNCVKRSEIRGGIMRVEVKGGSWAVQQCKGCFFRGLAKVEKRLQ